jgi:hypothetical protein
MQAVLMNKRWLKNAKPGAGARASEDLAKPTICALLIKEFRLKLTEFEI